MFVPLGWTSSVQVELPSCNRPRCFALWHLCRRPCHYPSRRCSNLAAAVSAVSVGYWNHKPDQCLTANHLPGSRMLQINAYQCHFWDEHPWIPAIFQLFSYQGSIAWQRIRKRRFSRASLHRSLAIDTATLGSKSWHTSAAGTSVWRVFFEDIWTWEIWRNHAVINLHTPKLLIRTSPGFCIRSWIRSPLSLSCFYMGNLTELPWPNMIHRSAWTNSDHTEVHMIWG